jgi:hypothetical protein
MRINKGTRAKKSRSTSAKKASSKAGAFNTRAVVVVVAGILGAAMIIGASASSRPTQVARLDAPSEYAPARSSASRIPADADIAGTSGHELADIAADGDPQSAIPPSAPPVTITGCLEREDDSFRLKNTSGGDAPKARSWKSGFLKKGSASVDLVNPPKKLRLSDHVGERVSLTGVLVDRDMQVRSLHRVAPSCN